jgi:hypothetical protein
MLMPLDTACAFVADCTQSELGACRKNIRLHALYLGLLSANLQLREGLTSCLTTADAPE